MPPRFHRIPQRRVCPHPGASRALASLALLLVAAIPAVAGPGVADGAVLLTYTITATAGPGGSISPAGAVSVPAGSDESFAITAAPCYSVADVRVDGISKGSIAEYTFTNVQADHTISVTFEPDRFTIVASAGTGGSITPTGEVSVPCGDPQRFDIASDACYAIDDVVVDGVSQGAVTSYEFLDVHAPHTIQANFLLIPFPIDVVVGPGGSVVPSGTVWVDCGQSRTFEITPDECHAIENVVVDDASLGPITSYTFVDVERDHTLEAWFVARTFTLTSSAGAGGTIQPLGSVLVGCDGSQSFNITPAACHAIQDVTVDGVSLGPVARYTFTNTRADHAIHATFALITFPIVATAGAGGSISPSGTVAVACGGSQAFAVAADSCYFIEDVRVDGQSVGPVTSYTFTNVAANHTLSAAFSPVENDSPAVSGLGANPVVLWPPDHSMRDVAIGYAASDCGPVGCALTVTSNEPAVGTGDGDLEPDAEVLDAHHVRLRAERAADGGGRVYTVRLTCTDAQGHATITTVPVVSVHDIASPPSGTITPTGSTLAFTGVFWDAPGSTHQATWTFNDSSIGGSVVEPSGTTNGVSATNYRFTLPGVYRVRMSLTDSHAVTSYATTRGDLPEIVAIYDTTDGYAAGGGWYASPPGALASNPAATGKMSFGFVSSFFKNPNNPRDPRGNLRFAFGQGGLEFSASSVTGVTIAGARARLTGAGSIVGDTASYAFELGIVDGALGGSGGTDRIRMKVLAPGTGAVVYDTQPGAADDAEPTTVVGAGSSIVLHYQGATPVSVPADVAPPLSFALAPTEPNPAHGVALLRYSLPVRGDVRLRLYDVTGRGLATLASGAVDAGVHAARLDVRALAGGVYFCRFEARTPDGSTLLHAETRKLLVAK